MSKEYIAKVLKKLRAKSGMTADDVGKILGKSGKTINGWENGISQPNADLFIQLCNIYNVDDILLEFGEIKKHLIDNDATKKSLINNYELLNEKGKEKLVEYSEDLVNSGNYVETSTKEEKLA